MLPVTAIYAAFLALLFIGLSARVILYRRSQGISLGDAGDPALLQRMRMQANCAEYAPFGLLMLGVAELQGAPVQALHPLGAMLLGGRALHAYAFLHTPPTLGLRVAGMALTLTMIAVSALGLLAHALV